MEYKNILVEKKDGVAIVSINRPKALNALNYDTLTELGDAFGKLATDDEARVLILTGTGEKAFVAGADISQMPDFNPIRAMKFATLGQNVFNQMEEMDKPIIAAVNGFALGGGTEIAMACDFIYASSKAKFGQPEINLGIIPGFGGTQRLPRLVSKSYAMEIILTGDMIDAQEAKRIGLINKIVEEGSVLDAAMETAKKIASKGRIAVKMAKECVNKGQDVDLRDGLYIEREAFSILCSTDDQKEGVGAFLEKRKPNFTDK